MKARWLSGRQMSSINVERALFVMITPLVFIPMGVHGQRLRRCQLCVCRRCRNVERRHERPVRITEAVERTCQPFSRWVSLDELHLARFFQRFSS